MNDARPKIVCIVGPTASGKTALSIAVAKEFTGEVISADSRQVYRQLDIGTEKVTEEEMDGIPHHLIDVADTDTVYTATDFARDSEKVITEIGTRGNLPIVAGGTFFYVDALLGRVTTPEVAPNQAFRAELETLDTEVLFEKLKELDPRRAAEIDQHNRRRLVRAIEIATTLGSVPEPAHIDKPFDALLIGIQTDREELRARIRARAASALERGLIEETQGLLQSGISKERLSEIGLQYPLVIDFLEDKLSKEDLLQKLEEKNWQYAKRQLTWLKRDNTIEWYAREDRPAIFTRVREFLS